MKKDIKTLENSKRIVYTTGWPIGLVENVTRGHVSSINDSMSTRNDHGNSGGAVFYLREGQLYMAGVITKPTSEQRTFLDLFLEGYILKN